MRVYFSTVVRTAPLAHGGELVQVDWDTKRLVRAVPILPSNPALPDPNPRGGRRGGRAIEVFGDLLVCASYDTLGMYDLDLNHRRDVTNALMVALHEVHPGGNGSIWITAAAIDAALRVDLATGDLLQQFWPREMPGFQRRLGLTPLAIDKTSDNRYRFLDDETFRKAPGHLHLNAVTSWRGETYALFNALGTVVNLDREEVLIKDPTLRGAHNLVICDDGTAFINQTNRNRVRVYDMNTRRLIRTIDVTEFPWVRTLLRRSWMLRLRRKVFHRLGLGPAPASRVLFMRGLSLVDHRLFVGLSPASILCIDWPTGKLVDAYNYSHDIRVSVHGLRAVPA